VVRLHGATALVVCVAYLNSACLAQRTQIQVVLVELAQEFPAVYIEAGFQLAVGESCCLFTREEAYDPLVELVGGRERVRFVVVGRGVRLLTSSLRPVSPSFSRRARASR
jgi:hypothetical protein